MFINTATDTQTLYKPATTGTLKSHSGNNIPTTQNSETVTITDAGLSSYINSLKQSKEASSSLELIGGSEVMTWLGTLALGGQEQLDKWKRQGLDVTEETILEAAKTFQESFKDLIENRSSPSEGHGFNRHQMVINTQAVPEWFITEYNDVLSNMENPDVRKAYEEGALYHRSPNSSIAVKAIHAYGGTNG